MRNDFPLSDEDKQDLSTLGLRWETVSGGSLGRVVIHGYPIPKGYNIGEVDLSLIIEPAYPETQIDMVYFHPPLIRNDGKAINALADDEFDGKRWQRWSRHRTDKNPWRVGIDNIASHLKLVDHWLKNELTR